MECAFLTFVKFLGDIKAGTGLACKLIVAVEGSGGIAAFQIGHESEQGCLLWGGAGVGGCTSVGFEAACIADADGAGIVFTAVGAGLVLGASAFNRAVKADEIVIAYAAPSLLTMEGVDLRGRHVAATGCGGAVDDNFRDFSH